MLTSASQIRPSSVRGPGRVSQCVNLCRPARVDNGICGDISLIYTLQTASLERPTAANRERTLSPRSRFIGPIWGIFGGLVIHFCLRRSTRRGKRRDLGGLSGAFEVVPDRSGVGDRCYNLHFPTAEGTSLKNSGRIFVSTKPPTSIYNARGASTGSSSPEVLSVVLQAGTIYSRSPSGLLFFTEMTTPWTPDMERPIKYSNKSIIEGCLDLVVYTPTRSEEESPGP